ncbi:MAG: hypothetical protein CTY19_03110 [Methylomonas sp.]|nr:MAG: hypothetical protein CTY19_03110 [Methylomonas sp.]
MRRCSTNLFVMTAAESEASGPFMDHEAIFFESSNLSTLVLKVRRKPDDLMAHVRRIYFCYLHALSDPLYAALLDLLIVLDDKGHDLSRRLITGCRSQLGSEQLLALNTTSHDVQQVQGNKYSLFTKGLIGTLHLLQSRDQQQIHHDALALAQDFIEYSQLEEAMLTLEQALMRESARPDIQMLLLELYQSTSSSERFRQQYGSMTEKGVPLIDAWGALAEVFAGKTL